MPRCTNHRILWCCFIQSVFWTSVSRPTLPFLEPCLLPFRMLVPVTTTCLMRVYHRCILVLSWVELSWVESSRAVWVCPELRTPLFEPGTQGGCSQVEEPNLSQQESKRLCKCMNRDNISIMRPVLYHQSLQKGLKPDLPPSTDNPSVIAPYY